MRVAAMKLKIEITLLLKFYHPFDGSSFTSVSTYFQNNISDCPLSNPRDVRFGTSHMGPIMALFSHREPVVSQGSMGIMPLLWQCIGMDFSEGRQLCLLGAHLLST